MRADTFHEWWLAVAGNPILALTFLGFVAAVTLAVVLSVRRRRR